MISFGQAALHYREMAAGGLEVQLEEMVVTVIGRAVVRAKSYIGHLQDSWPELSEATIEGFHHEAGFWIRGKRELGFSPPDFEPLLGRTGQLRESYAGETDGLTGIVGSDDKVAVYQEMGTPSARYPIPARPVCALAMMEATPDIIELSEEVCARTMIPTE